MKTLSQPVLIHDSLKSKITDLIMQIKAQTAEQGEREIFCQKKQELSQGQLYLF